MMRNRLLILTLVTAFLFLFVLTQSAKRTDAILNTNSNSQWLKTVHATNLHFAISDRKLNEIKIGIIDSGFKTHGPLQNIEFLNSSNYSSTEDHGDVVASIIGTKTAKQNIGMLPDVKIYAYNIPQRNLDSKSLAQAINDMKEHHIDILNISLNTPQANPALKNSLVSAINHGMLIVTSAGNSGTNLPSYPASYDIPGLISVGSVNSELNVTAFSTDNAQVTVFAPGEEVRGYNVNSGEMDTYNGTSVSVPFVSVLAFMIKAKDPSLSPVQIESKILQGADSYLGNWQGEQVRIRLINFQKTLT